MKKSLILSILLLNYWILSADSFYCKEIGIQAGLSHSSVSCLSYDGNGALWIGTKFGLNEYRNGRLRSFIDKKDGRLLGNAVSMIFTDSFGTLWVSTDKALLKYDDVSDSFVPVADETMLSAVQYGNTIFFGGHDGICTYNCKSGVFHHSHSATYTDLVDLYIYKDRLVSIDRRYGISILTPETLKSTVLTNFSEKLIMDSILDGDILYLSVMNLGLVAYDLSGSQRTVIYRNSENGMPDELILSLLKVGREIWIGTDGGGISILNLDTRQVKPIEEVHHFNTARPLPLSITTMYQDDLGSIWAGSVRSGLVALKASPIKTFSMLDADAQMADNTVIWLHNSEDGNIYLGTDGNGVFRYSPEESKMYHYPNQAGKKVVSMEDFDENNLIVCLYNQGFFRMNRQSGRLVPFILQDKKTNTSECMHGNAPKIYNIGDDRLLIFAVNSFVYDKRSSEFRRLWIKTEDDASELVLAGGQDSVMYAYSSTGIYAVDTESLFVEQMLWAPVEMGLINDAVFKDGILYVGTNYGLFEYNVHTRKLEKNSNALFNRISRLDFNSDGNLWVAADNMLFLYRKGVVEIVGENRGVPRNEILASAASPDGGIFFGGTAGFFDIGRDFYASASMENNHLELLDVKVAGKRYSSESGTVRVHRNYSSLILSVKLSGSDPFDKVMYRYYVDGQNEYIVDSYEDNISLPALKPGSYRVSASYLMANGVWSPQETVLNLRVLQPWYRSSVMLVIYYLLVLLAISYAIYAISNRKIKAMEAELHSRDAAFTGKLDGYISDHLSESALSVAEIAAHMAMSRASLYAKVNAVYGKGVAEIIDEKRMQRAEELLRTTSMSVLEISEKVGYSTSRYFSTRFKQLHDGLTPLKYRQSA